MVSSKSLITRSGETVAQSVSAAPPPEPPAPVLLPPPPPLHANDVAAKTIEAANRNENWGVFMPANPFLPTRLWSPSRLTPQWAQVGNAATLSQTFMRVKRGVSRHTPPDEGGGVAARRSSHLA